MERDRRDQFDARKDVWEMVTLIVEERKRREIDPTLTVLRQCVLGAEEDRRTDPEVSRASNSTPRVERGPDPDQLRCVIW